jgi:hypothetical protein
MVRRLTISLASGTAYLRRRTELTLDQGDCTDGSHSPRNTSRATGKGRRGLCMFLAP